MRTVVLTLLALFMVASTASAEWVYRSVPQSHYVTVHPNPVWTGSGWTVPPPYRERHTHYVQERYWVQPAPIIYSTPIYVCPHHTYSNTIVYPSPWVTVPW